MGEGQPSQRQKECRRRGLEPPREVTKGSALVELLVAVAVIINSFCWPTTIFVIQARRRSSAEHLEAEAINVATRQLETLQLEAGKGSLPTGTTSVIYPWARQASRVTRFKVENQLDRRHPGPTTSRRSCALRRPDVAQQIWTRDRKVVTWPGNGQHLAGRPDDSRSPPPRPRRGPAIRRRGGRSHPGRPDGPVSGRARDCDGDRHVERERLCTHGPSGTFHYRDSEHGQHLDLAQQRLHRVREPRRRQQRNGSWQ